MAEAIWEWRPARDGTAKQIFERGLWVSLAYGLVGFLIAAAVRLSNGLGSALVAGLGLFVIVQLCIGLPWVGHWIWSAGVRLWVDRAGTLRAARMPATSGLDLRFADEAIVDDGAGPTTSSAGARITTVSWNTTVVRILCSPPGNAPTAGPITGFRAEIRGGPFNALTSLLIGVDEYELSPAECDALERELQAQIDRFAAGEPDWAT